MSSFSIFDMIVIACGIYMAVNGIIMKTKGTINKGLVLPKNITEERLKDKEGFIKYMWPRLLICGVVVTISGFINIILTSIEGMAIADLLINMIFFVVLIIYAVIVSRAQKKFIY